MCTSMKPALEVILTRIYSNMMDDVLISQRKRPTDIDQLQNADLLKSPRLCCDLHFGRWSHKVPQLRKHLSSMYERA